MSTLQDTLVGRQPYIQTQDVRTPEQAYMDYQRQGMGAGLISQYTAAMNDPSYGFTRLPSVGEQQYDLDNVIADTFNKVSASGGGGSGYQNALASKAVADYRLNFLKQMSQVQNQARQDLRSSMVGANAVTPQPYASSARQGTSDIVSGVLSGAVGNATQNPTQQTTNGGMNVGSPNDASLGSGAGATAGGTAFA